LLGILRIEHLVEHLAKGNPPLRASA
jgi:hypothetical protein